MNKEQTYLRALITIGICWSVYMIYVYIIKGNVAQGDKSIGSSILSSITPKKEVLAPIHTPKLTNMEIRQRLGRATWTLLHTMAAVYPAFPTVQHKKDTLQFIYLISQLYPCGECAGHFQKLLTQHPPQVSSHDEFVGWLCKAHNVVNERLGKPIVDCANVENMWQCGCAPE
ncbi:FAD-linked sulfhydryl oxidase ERV1 [Nosema granulosis]|uniref:Sulfhydryl oxidase n=1 Tax=Nosema granulosis TaxID=83296 RepID=A0A9P6L0B0_9MICR|nr:FAD-linked sulfhydryl oxidase ERV1 [Nosema granulosis]